MPFINQKNSPAVLLYLGGLLLVVTCVSRGETSRADQAGALTPAQPMNTARAAHTATLLHDGSVLITGGFTRNRENDPFDSAERYDPRQEVFLETGAMTTGRQSHTATLLRDGTVLITGGYDGSYLASTEIYDPATGVFTATGSMATGRIAHQATRLDDGRVLISGGLDARMERLASAEIYDPATGLFSPVASMTTARGGHTQTLLVDGTVLIAGGSTGARHSAQVLADAEVFDPVTGVFRAVGAMTKARHKHAAVLMEDERVLIVGGSDERDRQGRYDSAEIYDPAPGAFTETGALNHARFKLQEAVTLLTDGTVLVAGGAETLELFDPQTERFTALAERFETAWYFSTATLLQDGRVLMAGGYDEQINSTANAWLYSP